MNDPKPLTFKVTLSEKQFMEIAMLLLIKPRHKIIGGILGFVWIMYLVGTGLELMFDEDAVFRFGPELFVPPIMFGVFYFLIRSTAVRNYRNNPRVQEELTYRLSEEVYEVIGTSFESKMSWDKINKVQKKGNWLLIWTSTVSANAIPITAVSKTDLSQIRNVIEAHGVKHNI